MRQEQRTEIRTSELPIFAPDQASGEATRLGGLQFILYYQGEVQLEAKSRNLGRDHQEELRVSHREL